MWAIRNFVRIDGRRKKVVKRIAMAAIKFIDRHFCSSKDQFGKFAGLIGLQFNHSCGKSRTTATFLSFGVWLARLFSVIPALFSFPLDGPKGPKGQAGMTNMWRNVRRSKMITISSLFVICYKYMGFQTNV